MSDLHTFKLNLFGEFGVNVLQHVLFYFKQNKIDNVIASTVEEVKLNDDGQVTFVVKDENTSAWNDGSSFGKRWGEAFIEYLNKSQISQLQKAKNEMKFSILLSDESLSDFDVKIIYIPVLIEVLYNDGIENINPSFSKSDIDFVYRGIVEKQIKKPDVDIRKFFELDENDLLTLKKFDDIEKKFKNEIKKLALKEKDKLTKFAEIKQVFKNKIVTQIKEPLSGLNEEFPGIFNDTIIDDLFPETFGKNDTDEFKNDLSNVKVEDF